jgi:hypothetical protein
MQALAQKINEESIFGCCIPNRTAVYRMKVRSMLKIKVSFVFFEKYAD